MPNDITLDGKGRIFFTDLMGRRVYRIDPDGRVERILGENDVEAPNGIVVSPDDGTLFLVEANSQEGGARLIRAYDLAEDGSVDGMRVFHDFRPGRSADGLAIDSAGNVYAAAGLNRPRGTSETLDTPAGIHVFAPDGRLVAFYPIPEDVVTNCAFGGVDMKTLYVTAGKTLFSIRTDVPGTAR
jgi:gluconolactonase